MRFKTLLNKRLSEEESKFYYREGYKERLQEEIKAQNKKLEEIRKKEIIKNDVYISCAKCKKVLPCRFQPSPDAGPFWRCSECGEIVKCCGGCSYFYETSCSNKYVPSFISVFVLDYFEACLEYKCKMETVKGKGNEKMKEKSEEPLEIFIGDMISFSENEDDVWEITDIKDTGSPKGPLCTIKKSWPGMSERMVELIYGTDIRYIKKSNSPKIKGGSESHKELVDKIVSDFYNRNEQCSLEKDLISTPKPRTVREALDVVFNTELDAPIEELKLSMCVSYSLSLIFDGQYELLKETIKEREKENEK